MDNLEDQNLTVLDITEDHRTNEESGNVDAVMNGAIDNFINAYLKWIALGNKKNS